MQSILGILYIIVGVVVAENHDYHLILTNIADILSFFLAVILWPAILLGANLHLAL